MPPEQDRIDPGEIIRSIASAAEKMFSVNDGDYLDEDGLLVCGTCHKRKQTYTYPYGEDDPERRIKVPCLCKCGLDKRKEEEEEKRRRKELERINNLRKVSLMDKMFENARFENFQENKYNARNRKLCIRYATHFNEMLEKCQGLLFWGGVGTGKSYAAACIANYLLDTGVSVVMTSLSRMTDCIQYGEESEADIINRMNRAKLVIFDDLGSERKTEYAMERAYNIIDGRYRSSLPVIVTTNMTMEEMMDESDIRYSRIFDRLFESCYPMQFTGISWRKKAAIARFEEMEGTVKNEV